VAISSHRLPWQERNPTAQELAGIAEMEFEMRTPTAKEPNVLAFPEWQKPVQEALIELDHEKLQARMAAAKTAISNRLESIAPQEGHQAEKQAIEDALVILRMLENQNRKAS
jgi:hypothetical protein